jgi:hypothetical protein
MKKGHMLFLWALAVLLFGAGCVWFFNLTTYNFWLANQNVPERLVYERRLYIFSVGLLLMAIAALFSFFRFIRAFNSEP